MLSETPQLGAHVSHNVAGSTECGGYWLDHEVNLRHRHTVLPFIWSRIGCRLSVIFELRFSDDRIIRECTCHATRSVIAVFGNVLHYGAPHTRHRRVAMTMSATTLRVTLALGHCLSHWALDGIYFHHASPERMPNAARIKNAVPASKRRRKEKPSTRIMALCNGSDRRIINFIELMLLVLFEL